jgi:hypothetical protein
MESAVGEKRLRGNGDWVNDSTEWQVQRSPMCGMFGKPVKPARPHIGDKIVRWETQRRASA